MKILQLARVTSRTSAPLDKERDGEELRYIGRALMPNIYSDSAGIVRNGRQWQSGDYSQDKWQSGVNYILILIRRFLFFN